MSCLTAAARQRCEQVKVPPQARGSQWKSRGIKKYKSDVFAVKFPDESLIWASPDASCMAAALLVPCAGSSGLPFMPRSVQGSIMHLHVFLKLAPSGPPPECHFFSCTASHMICQLVFVIRRGRDVCERWWDLAQVFCRSNATDRTFIWDLIDLCPSVETCDTYSEELPKSVSTSNRVKFILLKE